MNSLSPHLAAGRYGTHPTITQSRFVNEDAETTHTAIWDDRIGGYVSHLTIAGHRNVMRIARERAAKHINAIRHLRTWHPGYNERDPAIAARVRFLRAERATHSAAAANIARLSQ